MSLLNIFRFILNRYLIVSERVEGIIGSFEVHRFIRSTLIPNEPRILKGLLG